jgi:hypothetical protein
VTIGQLAAIRARIAGRLEPHLDVTEIAMAVADLRSLLDEVDRLNIERDALIKEKTTAVMLRDDERVMPAEAGMYVERWCTGTDWPCAVTSEPHGHWRTSRKVPVWAVVNTERADAFRRGTESMREAAARACEVSPIYGQKTTTARRYAEAIRALPIPEDKS